MGSSTCRLESLVVTFTGDGDQNARTEDDGRDVFHRCSKGKHAVTAVLAFRRVSDSSGVL